MNTSYRPAKQVFRHASDDQLRDCGRACAQMMIASIVSGVDDGVPPDPAQEKVAVIGQAELRDMEATPDQDGNYWHTDPDELADMLNRRSPGQDANWQVAACDDVATLFCWVGKTLQRRKPAAFTIYASNHWVCVTQAVYEEEVLARLFWMNPLNVGEDYTDGDGLHQYVDECTTGHTLQEAEVLGVNIPTAGSYQFQVGNAMPATYEGKFVGIVYGDPPEDAEVNALRERMQWKSVAGVLLPHVVMFAQLKHLARDFEGTGLSRLIESGTSAVRHVHDIDKRLRGYVLVADYSVEHRIGYVAAFDSLTRILLHAHITTNPKLPRSIIDSKAGRHYWWRPDPNPAMRSPYLPYRKIRPGIYRRLIDGTVLHL